MICKHGLSYDLCMIVFINCMGCTSNSPWSEPFKMFVFFVLFYKTIQLTERTKWEKPVPTERQWLPVRAWLPWASPWKQGDTGSRRWSGREKRHKTAKHQAESWRLDSQTSAPARDSSPGGNAEQKTLIWWGCSTLNNQKRSMHDCFKIYMFLW